MQFLIFSGYILLFVQFYNAEYVSYNYIFDYLSNVEVKLGENEYLHVLNYTGYIETSAFILTDDQELLLVKLNLHALDELESAKSVTGVVIRKKGVLERMVVNSTMENGMLNLLKGVVNLINIDEMRQNKTEADVNGECDVVYEIVDPELVIKEKYGCEKLKFYSAIPEVFDSFSIYQESNVRTHYHFNNDGVLVVVNSLETHLLESVLSDGLSQIYRSNTSLLFNKVIQSKIDFNSEPVINVIKNVFGDKHKDVSLMTVAESNRNKMIKEKTFIDKYKEIIATYVIDKRAFITMKIMNLFRNIMERSFLTQLKSNTPMDMSEVMHDAIIGCGTKICSEIVISELSQCLIDNIAEAKRMLLLIQHISRPSEYLFKALWMRISNMSEEVYDQGLQSIATLTERMDYMDHMEIMKQAVINYIQMKLISCQDNHCFQVHLSAARNTKSQALRHVLFDLLHNGSVQSETVLANVFTSLCSLDYQENIKVSVRNILFDFIKKGINFYVDSHIKYEAIFCLIRLDSDIKDVVYILDLLKDKNDHLNVFLTKKLKELIKMGIIEDDNVIFESKFFRAQNHHNLNYKDTSNVLVNHLTSTNSLYSDIHFNIIGENGGVIRNSMTDIFLVTTARENHMLSLATHISGLQSMVSSSNDNIDEPIEGLLQLVLFGKEARPITLFQGTSQLMSSIWYAPTELQSLLSGTLFPIDLYREISFQNGIVLTVDYVGSAYIDFSFKLNSNLWYKTATSLLRVSGQAYIQMHTQIKSLSNIFEYTQSFSLKSGLDFNTNVDFSVSPMKNCLSVSRPTSQIAMDNVVTKLKKHSHSSSITEIQGSCYSMSRLLDQLCTSF